jgi:hypothetical protein
LANKTKIYSFNFRDNKETTKVEIHLIDNGPKMIVNSTDLMVLPEDLKHLDPLAVDLRIVNLIPYDHDENWDHETRNELDKIMKKKKNLGDYMLCRVEFALNNTIFAKTLEVRKNISGVHVVKYTLKGDLLKRNFCLKDETVEVKLKEILKRANFYVPEYRIKEKANQKKSEPKQKIVQPEPKYKMLTIQSNYQVDIKHFESPNSFYVTLDNANNKILQKLMKNIEECDRKIVMSENCEGDFCLVARNGKFKRGKISTSSNDSIKVFLVDDGLIIDCQQHEIFEISADLISIVPFQAIQCRMAGVKPRFGMLDWAPRPSQGFHDFLIEVSQGKSLEMRVIGRNKNVYEVVLFHPEEKGKRLDQLAVEEKFADAGDEIPDEMLKDDSESDEPVEVMSEKPDEVMSKELKKILKLIEENNVETLFDLQNENLKSKIETKKQEKLNVSASDDEKMLKRNVSDQQVALPTNLTYIHKHPRIEWRQNKFAILLKFQAIDAVDYALNVDDSSLTIHIIYENSYEYTIVYLYGDIEVQYVSHEVAGQNIIVRLVKTLHFDWPRLTKYDEPNRFITFNHEDWKEQQNNGFIQHSNARPAGESEESDLENDRPFDEDDGDVYEPI